MSTSAQNASSGSSGKPLTGAFEMETKIRVIIQDVLNATMRKISQLHEKVENFEEFFFTFKQRIHDIEERSKMNENTLERASETINKNREESQNNAIKLEEENERMKIELSEKTDNISEINRKLTSIQRQNENLNNEISKTKSKFLEYTEQMTSLKEEVSWKISKYVEETAQVNTQIKVGNEEIKKQYFNVQLALEKNSQKYNQIIESKDMQESFNSKMKEETEELNQALSESKTQIRDLNTKLEEMDSAIYSKIKITELKLTTKIEELFESNSRIQESVKKVDKFSEYLEEVREDSEKTKRQLMKKFDEFNTMNKNKMEQEVLAINQSLLEFQKKNDKTIRNLNQNQEKTVDFFNQKLEYLKVQLETEISSKASRMLEQKSKSQSGVANSAVLQLQERMNKITLETTKSVNKLQSFVKEVKTEVKNTVLDLKESVETRITTTIKNIEESNGSGVSPQFTEAINEKMERISDMCEQKIFEMNKQLQEQGLKVLAVERLKEQTQQKFGQMVKLNESNFEDLETKLSGKVEKVMFLVTKMRGDAIIRNEFTDKELKELKRLELSSKEEIKTFSKLLPAFGECINLIMCLIFDAEYQHSKIIQDNLPSIGKDTLKFQNTLEGVLYEYNDKKKPGVINYRHKEMKKTQIVKATFNAYIGIWEDLFSSPSDPANRDRIDSMPRGFYKKYVEKGMNKGSQSNSPRKEIGQALSSQIVNNVNKSKEFLSSKELGGSEESRNYLANSSIESSENMNKSFQIRKKKNNTIRTKDDIIMVVREDIREQR